VVDAVPPPVVSVGSEVRRLEVIVPKVGLTITEMEVAQWLKAVGDRVEEGEVLVELEADKSLVSVEAPTSGTLMQILVDEGAETEVGATLGIITPS
jgi:pyruvate/2-oxoglutarate dehydrogenase complex dihydrolipoamide acyltransferase (E2) component